MYVRCIWNGRLYETNRGTDHVLRSRSQGRVQLPEDREVAVSETVSDYVILDWYDGPLCEIARVEFANDDPMVQICSLCTVKPVETTPSAPLRAAVSGDDPWTRATIRLTRADLVKMLDLVDGKPIEDWSGEAVAVVQAEKPRGQR